MTRSYIDTVADCGANSIDARIREAERSHEGGHMSWASCSVCDRIINTDDDPDACVDSDEFICETCREDADEDEGLGDGETA